MSYQSIVIMAGSDSLRARLVAAAAAAGLEEPMAFVDRNLWQLVSDNDMSEAWESAMAATDAIEYNPDTGARPSVVTDEMIERVVEERINELADSQRASAEAAAAAAAAQEQGNSGQQAG